MTRLSKNTIQAARTAQAILETLEGRVLMSGTAISLATVSTLQGLQLQITGTDGNDRITVRQSGNTYSIGGSINTTVTGSFTSLKIDTGNGNDSVILDASVTTNAIIHGGVGNDTLVGGNGNDTIYSGIGNDVIQGGAGDDTIVTLTNGKDSITGGVGSDSFWTKPTDTLTDLTAAERMSGNVHNISNFFGSTPISTARKVTATPGLLNAAPVEPTISTAGVSYRSFADHSLFASNGPSINDIRQGNLGDCYYLASLAAIAKTSPAMLKQDVADLGDGTYAVQFTRGSTSVFVRVSANLPTWSSGSLAYANLGAQGSLWVAILEKAWAVFSPAKPSYAAVEGGWMGTAFSALGLKNRSIFTANTGSQLLNLIQNELKTGHMVTYASDNVVDPSAPLIASHAYTVDGVNFDAKGNLISLRLRNPWGVDGAGHDGKNDGYVTLTAAQALNNMMGLVSASR